MAFRVTPSGLFSPKLGDYPQHHAPVRTPLATAGKLPRQILEHRISAPPGEAISVIL